MPEGQATTADLDALAVDLARGWELRDSGKSQDALAAWDGVLATEISGADDAVKLLIAQTRYAKAYLLLELGQASEAEALLTQAGDLARALAISEAQTVAADATEVRVAALATLGQHDRALELVQSLAVQGTSSGCFEVRLSAGRALGGAIWIHMQQHDRPRAIAAAQQLTELLRDQTDPARLIQASELILHSAEMLHSHSTWRRVPAPIIDQAHRMFAVVDEMAASAGGAVGAAVALNSRLAAANALALDRHVRASYKDRADRPPVAASDLTALEEVEHAARASGAEDRYLQLAFQRATTLHEAGRTPEAAALLDDLQRQSEAKGGLAGRGGSALIRATRKALGI